MRPDDAVPLHSSRRLRYLLTVWLLDTRREHSVAALVEVARAGGCVVPGRPSKAVSDALRWEVRRGRVVRVSRGRYRFGTMPRGTEWWIRACLAEDDRHRRSAA